MTIPPKRVHKEVGDCNTDDKVFKKEKENAKEENSKNEVRETTDNKRKNYVEEKESLKLQDEPQFQCDKCDKSYGSQRSLRQHMTRVHKEVGDCNTKKEKFEKLGESCEKITEKKNETKEDAKEEDSKNEVSETTDINNGIGKEGTAKVKERVKVNVKFGDKSYDCQMKPEQKMGKLMDQLKERTGKDAFLLHNKERVDPEDMSKMYNNSQIEMVEDKGDE